MINLSQNRKRIISVILVVFFSTLFVVEGLDKFLNILEKDWTIFLNPKFLLFPIVPVLFMKLVGVFEVLLGLSLWTRWRRWSSYIIVIWLTFISINLFSLHLNSMALRDILIAIGALVMVKLID